MRDPYPKTDHRARRRMMMFALIAVVVLAAVIGMSVFRNSYRADPDVGKLRPVPTAPNPPTSR